MSFSTIRRRIAVCGTIAMVSAVAGSQAGAQAVSSEGGWGGEGRIGSGNAVYLSRWFSSDWSLLLGGNAGTSSTKSEGSNNENTTNSGNLAAMLRRNWGGGALRPFIAAGPSFNFSGTKTVITNVANGSTTTQKNDITGIGARGELGALVPVSSKVYLGLSTALTYNRNSIETTNLNSTSKTTQDQISVGNLQFIVGFRF